MSQLTLFFLKESEKEHGKHSTQKIKNTNQFKLELDVQVYAISLKKNIWGVYENEFYKLKFYQPIVDNYWKVLNSKIFN